MTKKPKHKGGKGFKSPYETTHIRVALPIKDQCENLKKMYDNFIENGGDPNNPPDFLNSPKKLQDTLYGLNELERFVTMNNFICTKTSVCPNWTTTIRIINDIKSLILKR